MWDGFFTAYWRKVNGTDPAPRQIPGSKSPHGDTYDRAGLSTDAASGAWYISPNFEELEVSLNDTRDCRAVEQAEFYRLTGKLETPVLLLAATKVIII
ncbi:MAG: hypothetical protein HQK96_01440 [Nitrospirae bacterium]|nr:hypothetical protein [Nitrospirota bacterium]